MGKLTSCLFYDFCPFFSSRSQIKPHKNYLADTSACCWWKGEVKTRGERNKSELRKEVGGKRRKWEQRTKKETATGRENEDATDWECQGKGQLPLQHFSLINYGKPWSG